MHISIDKTVPNLTPSFVTIVILAARAMLVVKIFRRLYHLPTVIDTFSPRKRYIRFTQKNYFPREGEKFFLTWQQKHTRNLSIRYVTDIPSISYGNLPDKYHLVKFLQNSLSPTLLANINSSNCQN